MTTTNTRVTDIDRHLFVKIADLRKTSGARMATVARHLGMAYQSYMKLEGARGGVSIRASYLDALAEFYSVPINYFFHDVPARNVRNTEEAATVVRAMRLMPDTMAKDLAAYAVRLQQGA